MVLRKIFKADNTVETVSYENSDYFKMIGRNTENLMQQIRMQRNQLLAQSDWRATVDYPGTDKQLWLDYRQVLRDLPATQEPKLDDQGNLTNVTWPEVPE